MMRPRTRSSPIPRSTHELGCWECHAIGQRGGFDCQKILTVSRQQTSPLPFGSIMFLQMIRFLTILLELRIELLSVGGFITPTLTFAV